MLRALKYFCIAVGVIWPFAFLVGLIVYPIDFAPVFASIISFVFGLFCLGFMQRNLQTIEFEINSKNKDPQRGLKWYEDEIRDQLMVMRYTLESKVQLRECYLPPALWRYFSPKFYLEVTPYNIIVTGSRLMIYLLSENLDIEIKHTH